MSLIFHSLESSTLLLLHWTSWQHIKGQLTVNKCLLLLCNQRNPWTHNKSFDVTLLRFWQSPQLFPVTATMRYTLCLPFTKCHWFLFTYCIRLKIFYVMKIYQKNEHTVNFSRLHCFMSFLSAWTRNFPRFVWQKSYNHDIYIILITGMFMVKKNCVKMRLFQHRLWFNTCFQSL